MTALTAMPEERLRSPTALVGVLAAHVVLAWGLTHLALQPERLPEPLVVALLREVLPEPEPEPDMQAQPLPQADAAPAPRRVVRPTRPATVPQIAPPPLPDVREPVHAPPVPVPLTQPAPSPVPPLLARDTPPAPEPAAELQPAADPEPPPSTPALAVQPPAGPAAAPVEEAPAAQPLFAADYLRNPKPRYPMMSRRMGEEGLVKLRVFVTSAGEPRQVELQESCGFPRLDQAALDVVRNWRFVPAKRGDSPVDSWVVVPIRFTLKG